MRRGSIGKLEARHADKDLGNTQNGDLGKLPQHTNGFHIVLGTKFNGGFDHAAHGEGDRGQYHAPGHSSQRRNVQPP